MPINPKRPGGGGIRPPLDISHDNFAEIFSRAASFHGFFLSSFAQLLALFSGKIGRMVRKLRNIMCSSVGSKFENFLDLCTKHMENGFLCENSILSSKMQYLHSLQLKLLLYLLIFNTQTIPKKKTIKYISHKNTEIHKKFTKQ